MICSRWKILRNMLKFESDRFMVYIYSHSKLLRLYSWNRLFYFSIQWITMSDNIIHIAELNSWRKCNSSFTCSSVLVVKNTVHEYHSPIKEKIIQESIFCIMLRLKSLPALFLFFISIGTLIFLYNLSSDQCFPILLDFFDRARTPRTNNYRVESFENVKCTRVKAYSILITTFYTKVSPRFSSTPSMHTYNNNL